MIDRKIPWLAAKQFYYKFKLEFDGIKRKFGLLNEHILITGHLARHIAIQAG